MAKKIAPEQRANSVSWDNLPSLSFDGGCVAIGGFGNWYPIRLSDEELEEACTENGKRLDRQSAQYSAGNAVGAKAAHEYVARMRILKSNFWEDESGADLAGIVLAMMEPCDCPERRRGEVVSFFQTLYPYLAFGARNVCEADKAEHAKR